ncbi:Rep [Circular ssDNA virus sp.]|nr:Rep [Circular ssDNA virus sp.]
MVGSFRNMQPTHAQQVMNRRRGRRWVFTWNNYTDDDVIYLQQAGEAMKLGPRDIDYIVFGKEVGESGTPHLQGYIHFSQMVDGTMLGRMLRHKCHTEIARGSEADAAAYCKKDGIFFERGQMRGRETLTKTKASRMIERINEGANFQEIMNDFAELAVRYQTSIKSLITDAQMQRWNEKGPWNGDLHAKNFWVWGPAGSGKSTWARKQRTNPTKIYPKSFNKWWDGFRPGQHDLVIIDDYPIDSRNTLLQHIKIWADRFTFTAEQKGGSIAMWPGAWNLIITSNHSIDNV